MLTFGYSANRVNISIDDGSDPCSHEDDAVVTPPRYFVALEAIESKKLTASQHRWQYASFTRNSKRASQHDLRTSPCQNPTGSPRPPPAPEVASHTTSLHHQSGPHSQLSKRLQTAAQRMHTYVLVSQQLHRGRVTQKPGTACWVQSLYQNAHSPWNG